MFRIDLLDRGTAARVREMWGVEYGNQMFYSSPEINAWYCDKSRIAGLGDFILNKVKNEKGFVDKIALATEKSCLNLVKIAAQISSGNLKKLSNRQLALRLEKYIKAHYDFCAYFDVSNSIKDIGTQQIKDGLWRLLKAGGDQTLINDYVEALLKSEKIPLTNQEQIDLRKIAPEDAAALEKHVKKYEWLSVYNPDDASLPPSYFQDRIKQSAEDKLVAKQLKKLATSNDLQRVIRLMKKYVYLHTFRAEMLSKSYFLLKPFLSEIATRWEMDLATVCAMTAPEIVDALVSDILPDFDEINRRKISYLHLMKNGVINIYSSKTAQELFLKEIGADKEQTPGTQISGTVVSQGLAQGRVCLILDKKDLGKIKSGEILVAAMTSPDYVSAIQRSGAVVTDEGGLLCHAAIICREMGKPCVVGTKNATLVLKNGDLIKVDAIDGKVIKL